RRRGTSGALELVQIQGVSGNHLGADQHPGQIPCRSRLVGGLEVRFVGRKRMKKLSGRLVLPLERLPIGIDFGHRLLSHPSTSLSRLDRKRNELAPQEQEAQARRSCVSGGG